MINGRDWNPGQWPHHPYCPLPSPYCPSLPFLTTDYPSSSFGLRRDKQATDYRFYQTNPFGDYSENLPIAEWRLRIADSMAQWRGRLRNTAEGRTSTGPWSPVPSSLVCDA